MRVHDQSPSSIQYRRVMAVACLDCMVVAGEFPVEAEVGQNSRGQGTPRNHTGAPLPGPRQRTGSFTAMDLPGFIGQLLGQYQELLVDQVEREIKNQAVAAFKEQTYLLRWRALEGLCSWESGVQQKIQDLLDQVRDKIFDVIHQEASEIYAQLQGTVEGLVEEATGGIAEEAAGEAQEAAPPVARALASPRGQDARQDADSGEKGKKEEVRAQEVHLVLLPPLDAKPMLWFYQGLLENREVSVIRTVGSLEKGVSVYIRQKRSSSLTEVLQRLPGVVAVASEASPVGEFSSGDEGTDDCPTLRIQLMPAKVEEKATPAAREPARYG